MNLDNKSVDALSQLIKRAPALKPLLMFHKTSMNLLAFSGSHNPLGVIINDLNAFKQPLQGFYLQPILLDLEKLFLRSKTRNSGVKRPKSRKN